MYGDSPEADKQAELPWPAASTPALLSLLVRFWASPSRQAGALSSEQGRNAAESLLASLVGVLHGRVFEIHLLLDEGVKFEWPRPPQGASRVVWVVTGESMVTLAPEGGDGRLDPELRMWAAGMGVDPEQQSSLMELLHAMGAWRPRKPARRSALMGQVLLVLAGEIESVVLEALQSPQQHLTVQQSDFNYAMSSLQQVNSELLKYLQAQQLMSSPMPMMLSLASDKSRVHGLSLCSTVLALPSGQAAWAFPVVLHVSGLVGRKRSLDGNCKAASVLRKLGFAHFQRQPAGRDFNA